MYQQLPRCCYSKQAIQQANMTKIAIQQDKIFSIPTKIYSKYSSSQMYYYSKAISNLVEQKRSANTTKYQDIEQLVDDDQYMKRTYGKQQFRNKMITFKEYYYYHQDCPRIFLPDVEIIYAKWQDRRRNLVYKKLKHLFNDDKSEATITENSQQVHGNSHFLYQLSQYNPFSKKYYLRVEGKKLKQQEKRRNCLQKIQTREQISQLRHDLSAMLMQMNQLSIISTLNSSRFQKNKHQIYHRKTMTHTESGSCQQSTNSNSGSGFKLNFRKKAQINNSNKQFKKHKKIGSSQKCKLQIKNEKNDQRKESTSKLHPVQNNQQSFQKIKSKSIFAFTSLGSLGQFGQENNKIKINTRRQQLKINLDLKVKQEKKQSEGSDCLQRTDKIIENDEKKKTISIRCNSFGKLKPQKVQFLDIRNRQNSLRKIKTRPDQFCDKKLTILPKMSEQKFSSYKSEHVDNKKEVFKIKPNDIIINKKKKLQLKI